MRVAVVVFAACFAIASFDAKAAPALVFDVKTGDVLHQHEATRLWFPASLTKIMTTYVALRMMQGGRIRQDTPLAISANAAAQPPSKLGLPVGQTIQLGTALQVLMVKSANDVAVAVAEGVAGSEPAFIQMMNSEAQRLGMTSTRFVNPHGLPDRQQVSSARDMALLAVAIYRDFPQFHYLYTLTSVTVGGTRLRSHNTLLGSYSGADGLKTGFICDSGFNIVATASRNGRRLGVVIMGSPNATVRHDYATHLLTEGFDQRPSGILNLVTASTPKLSDLRGTPEGPGIMRPYVCGPRSQRQPIPPDLAYYGVTLPDATIVEQPNLPLAALSTVPMPRANPQRLAGSMVATTTQTDVEAAIDPRYPLAPGIPLPRSRPLVQ